MGIIREEKSCWSSMKFQSSGEDTHQISFSVSVAVSTFFLPSVQHLSSTSAQAAMRTIFQYFVMCQVGFYSKLKMAGRRPFSRQTHTHIFGNTKHDTSSQ